MDRVSCIQDRRGVVAQEYNCKCDGCGFLLGEIKYLIFSFLRS